MNIKLFIWAVGWMFAMGLEIPHEREASTPAEFAIESMVTFALWPVIVGKRFRIKDNHHFEWDDAA